jgi:hypothetical protein
MMGLFDIVKGIGGAVFPPLGLAQQTQKVKEATENKTGFTAGPMAQANTTKDKIGMKNGGKPDFLKGIGAGIFPPVALLQQTKKISDVTTKEKAGIKNGNGNGGNGEVTIEPDAPPAPPGPGASIFPPLALWQQSQYMKELKQWEGKKPDVTITGYSAEEVKDLLDSVGNGGNGNGGNGNGGFGGTLETFGQGLDVIGKAIPIVALIWIASQVKGLFK